VTQRRPPSGLSSLELDIYLALCDAGELGTTELATVLGIPRSRAARALASLRRKGVAQHSGGEQGHPCHTLRVPPAPRDTPRAPRDRGEAAERLVGILRAHPGEWFSARDLFELAQASPPRPRHPNQIRFALMDSPVRHLIETRRGPPGPPCTQYRWPPM